MFKKVFEKEYTFTLQKDMVEKVVNIVDNLSISNKVSKLSNDTLVKDILVKCVVEEFMLLNISIDETVVIRTINNNPIFNTTIVIASIDEVKGVIYNYD